MARRDPRLRIACPESGKTVFATQRIAEDALKEIWRRPRTNKKPTRAYECPHCGWWHLTGKWEPLT